MAKKTKTLKEISREEPVTPPTWVGEGVSITSAETASTPAPVAPATPAETMDEMISKAFNDARLKVAQDMLNAIMTDPNVGPAELAIALHNEKLHPFLSQLTRCWSVGASAHSSPAAAAQAVESPRRGRPPKVGARRGRPAKAAKAAKTNMSKGPRQTRVRFTDEERTQYNDTVLSLITASGKQGIYKQDLMEKLGEENDRWAGKQNFLIAALQDLGKQVNTYKDGTKVYYTV